MLGTKPNNGSQKQKDKNKIIGGNNTTNRNKQLIRDGVAKPKNSTRTKTTNIKQKRIIQKSRLRWTINKPTI